MYGGHQLRLVLFISGCQPTASTRIAPDGRPSTQAAVNRRIRPISPAPSTRRQVSSRSLHCRHADQTGHSVAPNPPHTAARPVDMRVVMANRANPGYRFSAFWLRSKCSICSYQLNIWYGDHVSPSILNWFLTGEWVQELAPTRSRVGLALQYR